MRFGKCGVATAVALLLGGVAQAAATPTLTEVGHNDRRPFASFTPAASSDATIYISTSPERASDGAFLDEKIEDLDTLTDDEIANGYWTANSQIDPGRYWVLMRSYDSNYKVSWSNMAELVVPVPPIRFTTRASALRNIRVLYLHIKAMPLGVDVPYRVCWRPRGQRKERCVRDTLSGYSWNSAGTGTVRLSMRGMRKRTTFRWVVDEGLLAKRVVRTS